MSIPLQKATRVAALVLSAASAAAITSCTRVLHPQRWVADQFLERYVVQASPREALELTGGGARRRLLQEIGSVPERASRLPEDRKLTYDCLSEEKQGEERVLQYRIDVMNGLYTSFRRRLEIRLRREGGRWLVSDFTFTG